MSSTSNNNHSNPIVKRVRETLDSVEGFENALPKLFEIISEELDGQWIGYWAVDEKKTSMKLLDYWHSDDIHAETFDEDVRKRVLSSGEGMPGKVWRLRKPIRSSDLMKDMMLPKSLKAYAAGFKSGFWFPVYSNGTVYGVFEILRFADIPVGEEVMQILEIVGKELGRYLQQLENG